MRTSTGTSSKKTTAPKGEPLDRPFDADLFERAAASAGQYRVILEREGDGFLARPVEFPTIFARGASPNECERKVREALTVAIATMLEMGETPPLPASERRAQVNIRLADDEKLLLEESARRAGFRGLSDFVRFAALSMARGGPSVRRRAG